MAPKGTGEQDAVGGEASDFASSSLPHLLPLKS